MKNEALKGEARRLRSAITDMFGVRVSVAQSLELVAKAKNYPNWDAASACAVPALPSAPVPMFNVTIALRSNEGKVSGLSPAETQRCEEGALAQTIKALLVRHGFETVRLICQLTADRSTAVIAPEWDESTHGFETHPFSVSIRAPGETLPLGDIARRLSGAGLRVTDPHEPEGFHRWLFRGPGIYLVAGAHNSGRSTTMRALMREALGSLRKALVIDGNGAGVASPELDEQVSAAMRMDPDLVLFDELASNEHLAAAIKCVCHGGAHVLAGIVCANPDEASVVGALNALDPTGLAPSLVRGIIWLGRGEGGRLEVKVLRGDVTNLYAAVEGLIRARPVPGILSQ